MAQEVFLEKYPPDLQCTVRDENCQGHRRIEFKQETQQSHFLREVKGISHE